MPAEIELLEHDFAARFGLPHVLPTAFGRTAAWLAVHSLATSQTNEVLLPNFICRQLIDAVSLAGASPRFYPVPRHLIIEPHHILAAKTPQTSAAFVPHFFGRVQPHLPAIINACTAAGIAVIEDCALALGARSDSGVLAGASAQHSIFSFTKSDWCYGGGAFASRNEAAFNRAASLYSAKQSPQPAATLAYGRLRRLDLLANCPSRSMFAELRGHLLQQSSPFGDANFYDAAPFDAAVTPHCARRACRILHHLDAKISRKREIRSQILAALPESLRRFALSHTSPQDAASHLVLRSPDGRAEFWAEEAAREGIALRRTWPAFQSLHPAQHSPDVDWLAGSCLLLEIHPGLSREEIALISSCLVRLENI